MKNIFKYTCAILAVGLVSCEPEFENSVNDPGVYSSGNADFSRYVAVGNCLTAGYSDGTRCTTGQKYSCPSLMAERCACVGGGEFTLPLVNDNMGGMLSGGTQLLESRLILEVGANGNPGPVRLQGTPSTDAAQKLSGTFQNMGVPGAKSFHLVAPGYGNPAGIAAGMANPYFARFASSDNATVIGDA